MKDLYTYLICEGGAGGHMLHPYLLPYVNSGKDLMQFFDRVVDNFDDLDASMKIDGVNASIRIKDGEYVFDRMDQKDINGIHKDELEERFGHGHGLVKAGGIVLDIFNAGIDKCKSELKQLGLLDNEKILFNIEYVDKTTNLISYENSFLAIHGLLEFEQSGNKRTTHEIKYNKKALESFVEKMNKIAESYGFNVIGSVVAEPIKKPDINKVYNTDLTINITGEPETKTLKEWLDGVKDFNPKPNVATLTKMSVGSMSKKAYNMCADTSIPLNTIFKPNHIENIVNCYIAHIATLMFGNEALSCIDSKLGKGTDNEGIVIRNKKITKIDAPVKLVGEFMINVSNSRFNKK